MRPLMSEVSDLALSEVSLEHTLNIKCLGSKTVKLMCYNKTHHWNPNEVHLRQNSWTQMHQLVWLTGRVSSWVLGLSTCWSGRAILHFLPAKGSWRLFLSNTLLQRMPWSTGGLGTEVSTAYPVTAFPLSTQLADDQGLVLMTTVAMPVFSKQNETVSMILCLLPGAGRVISQIFCI